MAIIGYKPSENPSGSPTPYSKLRFKIEAVSDIATNSSNVTVTLQASTEDHAGQYETMGKITINGTAYTDDHIYTAIIGYSGWFDIWTRTATVKHNDAGDGVLTLKVEPTGERDYYSLISGGSTGYSTPNDTYSIALPKIETGLVYIDNGSSFDKYLIYIDDGTAWHKYSAYIDDGTVFKRCV